MPHKTFPRALSAAVVLVVLTYALPLMVGLGVTQTMKDWKLGYFSYIAHQVMHYNAMLCCGLLHPNKKKVWC